MNDTLFFFFTSKANKIHLELKKLKTHMSETFYYFYF